ncbi:ATP-binding protein [Streptomyces sp. URMC 123]|uniref:ATP-binding protein n=1 Tax=Streptomyces sp. URMC 123 TaxID=3423403 RepID=UPI003F1DD61D
MTTETPLYEAPPAQQTRVVGRRGFAMNFPSVPRAARLARRLCGQRLVEWGFPSDTETWHTVTLLAGELVANAVRHGAHGGKAEFRLVLTADPAGPTLRVEVSDTCPAPPVPVPAARLAPDAESGRGLLLVEALATRWGIDLRSADGKTIWAEYAVRQGSEAAEKAGNP